MSRRILQERRVRAIAAVHALLGGAVVLGSIAWLAIAASHTHGPSDLGALGAPILGGVAVMGGVTLVVVACLLWMYKPIAQWTTGALFAFASALSVHVLVKYSVDDLIREGALWIRGADSSVFHYVRGALIETLVVVWSAVVLVALFRPDSRQVFSTEYRKSIRADPGVRIRFYLSPYFVTGLIVWLIIGWAASE
jgi:hypothetical protein